MSIDEKQEYVATEAAAPRWMGIVVIALAIVSLVALGIGWTASTRSKELAQNLTTAQQQEKQQEDVLSQRLAKAEDTNAQLQGELSVVTDKMKLTQGELEGPLAGQEDQGRRRQATRRPPEQRQRPARHQGQR